MASLSPEMGGTYTLGADGMYNPTWNSRKKKHPGTASTAECAILTSGNARTHTIPLGAMNYIRNAAEEICYLN